MPALTVLVCTVLAGLSAFGFSALFRALPWPARWLASRHWAVRKLFDCAACAGGRGALLSTPLWLWGLGAQPTLVEGGLIYLGATGIAAYFYAQLFPAPLILDDPSLDDHPSE